MAGDPEVAIPIEYLAVTAGITITVARYTGGINHGFIIFTCNVLAASRCHTTLALNVCIIYGIINNTCIALSVPSAITNTTSSLCMGIGAVCLAVSPFCVGISTSGLTTITGKCCIWCGKPLRTSLIIALNELTSNTYACCKLVICAESGKIAQIGITACSVSSSIIKYLNKNITSSCKRWRRSLPLH